MRTKRARLAAGSAMTGLLMAGLLMTSLATTTLAATSTVEARVIGTNGTVLVAGSNSMTVYTFTKDVAGSGTSACTGGCLTVWPALTVAAGETPTAGAGVTGTLGTITRSDTGAIQATYNGLPLYFFSKDTKPGDTNGHYPNWNLVVLAADTADVLAKEISGHGTVLTAANGMTVYTFTKDVAGSGTSACTGGCLTVWPALTVAAGETPTGGPGVTGTLGTITRSDTGAAQVTYNGLPLYFFSKDTKPGDTNGFYPNWNLVVLAAAATPTPAATATATPASPTLPPTSTAPAQAPVGTTALAGWLLILVATGAGSLALAARIARRNR